MTLLFLFLLLVVPYLVLTLAHQWLARCKVAPTARARVGLSLFFLFTATGHFLRTRDMSAMLPPVLPYPLEIVYLTGVLEFLGGIGVWFPRVMRFTGVCLMLMLLGFLPVNIYAAIQRLDFGGHGAGPAYLLLRVPFQFFVIWWTYYATEQQWFVWQPKEAE